MTATVLTLPAVDLPATRLQTAAGAIVVPGHTIPEKCIAIDPDEIARLVRGAREAARNAYAPYSRFRVGAALVMADDPARTVVSGANIENSAYGVASCAERTGLFHSAARGFRRLRALAVSTADALGRPLSERSPCGICRQAIREFSGSGVAVDEALILIDNADPETLCEVFDIERLLPYGFSFAGPGQT